MKLSELSHEENKLRRIRELEKERRAIKNAYAWNGKTNVRVSFNREYEYVLSDAQAEEMFVSKVKEIEDEMKTLGVEIDQE